jgi:hypothetical protein
MGKLIKSGEIAYSRIGTGRGNYLFLEGDLLEYINRNKVNSCSAEETHKENNTELKPAGIKEKPPDSRTPKTLSFISETAR